jgi:superfamily II DNA or RNA helicase/HKD family nuclease
VTDLARGAYEHLVTRGLEARLERVDNDLVQRVALDPADADDLLTRHIAALTRRALRAVPGGDAERLAQQVEVANRIAEAIADIVPSVADPADLVAASRDLLAAIVDRPAAPARVAFPARPEIPLSTGALLVNGRGQPRIGHEVASEMASADEVDLLCAFIKWHGLRLLEGPIRELTGRGGRLRVITTTYLGATDQRALDRLAELGAEIRVSYETKTTRLHAKAWLFRRATGATTAYVGSSNLSKAALVDGLEWNVRLSELEQPHILDTFEATFDEYWHDPAFEAYDPQRDADRLRRALATESGTGSPDPAVDVTSLDVRPYGYQREILDELAAEREVHGHRRNLVVMATGTGKTVVAALDYKRLHQAGTVNSLLFVAHQERILQQSRSVFRHVLRDGRFGETFVGGERPREWRHVFASVQSLHRLELDQLDPARFDMVIVDEFHHAEAPTYLRLLDRLRPRILLGLTATPERADGQDIRHWFDGRTAVELRLWEALERQLLAPFQYFGIHDDVDLSTVRWRRGQGYDQSELSNLYTGHDARARIVLQAVRDKLDVNRMRAIGFCVSIDHANFMANWFRRAGIPAVAVTSRLDQAGRDAAVEQLKKGEIRAIFTVDLFNEGIDLPMVDTILMLRPTESATIFLQQLGRGLRLADDKPCLTVLDFIGGQHADFRFDLRYRALTGAGRRALARDVEHDFPTLPAGCHLELDRVAKQVVLRNVQAALRLRWPDLAAELRRLADVERGDIERGDIERGDIERGDFLRETGLELEDLYRRKAGGGWTGLRRRAGIDVSPPGPQDAPLGAAIGRMLHLDDPVRLDRLRAVASGSRPPPDRVQAMLHAALWGASCDVDEGIQRLWANPRRCAELRQVASVLGSRIRRVSRPVDLSGRIPLRLHARYSRDEVRAAFGVTEPVREGVKWVEAEQADLFFVTLTKTERHYSPTTMYADRAVTPELFQWESQSTTSTASPTGQRYAHHASRGSAVHLFVRESKETDGDLGAPPYLYAGRMTYVRHSGDRPMRILWRLRESLPGDVFHAARVAAG